jgi:hypothetical protein
MAAPMDAAPPVTMITLFAKSAIAITHSCQYVHSNQSALIAYSINALFIRFPQINSNSCINCTLGALYE